MKSAPASKSVVSRLLHLALLPAATCLLAAAPQDGPEKGPVQDRPMERFWDEVRWMGGLPTPEHLEFKKQVATEHLTRFAESFPRSGSDRLAPQIPSSNAVTWTCIGPTKGTATYAGITNPDIDSGRISPNGLALSADGQTLYLASALGGLWKTTTANQKNTTWTWTPLTDSLPIASSTGNIPIGAVALSPSGTTLYIGSGDFQDSYGKGFFRSVDGGSSWTETSKTNLCGLYASDYISCIFSVDENTLLVGGNAGLFRSTDGGATFGTGAVGNRVLGSNGYGDRIWSVEQVGSSSQNLVASMEITGSPATGTAHYSSDGGITWHQASITGTGATSTANIGRITLKSNKAAGNLNVWGIAQITPGRAMFKGIFLSVDGGRNYVYVPDATSPAALYLAAGAGDGNQGNYNQCLAVSQTDTSVASTKVFTATNLGFYRSSNGGSTWTWMTNWYAWVGTPMYSHADKHAAIWSPDGSTLYVGSDGGLSVFWDPFRASPPLSAPTGTPLSDTTFVDNRHNEGLSTHLVYHLGSTIAASPVDSISRVTIGLQDNSVRRRAGSPLASSTQFDETYASGDGFGTLIHKLNGDKFIFSGVGTNMGYSLDGGVTYHGASITLADGAPFHTRVEPGRADSTGDTAFTATNYKLFKSTNFGQSWAACGMGGFPTSGSSYIRNFNSSSLDTNKLAIVDVSHCWISADGGATWTDKGAVYPAGGAEVALGYVWFDTLNDSVMYAASVYAGWGPTIQHLWRSGDGGTSWQNIEGTGFPSGNGVNFGGPVHIIQNDPTTSSTLLAGTDFGVYVSTDTGATWSRYGVGLPMVGVRDFYLAPDGSLIRAATYGRGVWESTAVANPPNILAQPADASAFEGLNTSFSVQATGAMTYQWQVDSGSGFADITNGAIYSGATMPSLSITGATAAMNGYHYQVVVTGSAAAVPHTVTSTPAALTVLPAPPPSILTQPSNAGIAVGGNGSFTVTGSNVTAYQWQVNTGSGFVNVTNVAPYSNATTATLNITAATLGMNGYLYQVVLTGAPTAVPPTVTSSSVALTVASPPAFTGQPANATTAAGGNATFTATVTGATSYQWQQKIGAGAWTDLSDGGVYSGTTTASLTLTAVPIGMDGYTYHLVATGAVALTSTSSTVTLNVKLPAAITVQPADISSTFNAQTHFSVTATGYSLTYQWQVNPATGVWSNISDVVNYGGFTTASLSAWVSTTMGGYQYRVIVTGAVGAPVTSTPATLTVLCSPSITGQPATVAINTGANASFTVTATSALGYIWKVSTGGAYATVLNGGVYSGASGATLSITGATAGMNGYLYQATVVGCAQPNALSTPATLWVGVAPNITAQPANATVAAGGNTSLNVTATGASSYQWQVSTGGAYSNVTNGGVYSGATTSTLTITGATAGMNGYLYQVIATGAVAPAATSNPASLTVNNAPNISGQPANATVTAGGNASFTVTATGATSYQWQVSSGGAYSNVPNAAPYSNATTATLNITGATVGMNGYLYQVVVSGPIAPAATSIPASLTVNTAPSITGQPANTTVNAGGNASFTVIATGATAYQWQVSSGGAFANVTNVPPYSNATTATLNITGATAGMDGYSYQVVVTGSAAPSATSTAATLNVNSAPNITGQPINTIVAAGGNALFSVTTTGTGLTYQWQQNSGSGFVNLTNAPPFSNVTTATLNITGATAGMSGYLYQVIVSGTVSPAATSLPATLTVNTAPNITGHPGNATVTAGGNTSFTVTATGTGLTYQWQLSTGGAYANVPNAPPYSNATTATLNITGASAGMNGYLYQVVVTGTAAPAATSTPATLTVNVPPSITTPPQSQIVVAGSPVTFTVVAAGTAPISYQWRKNAVNIPGQTGTSFAIASTVVGDAGSYDVVVTNAAGGANAAATLTVNPAPVGPSITTQPQSQSVVSGTPATFSVVATGAAPLAYQWRKDSAIIPGQTGSSFTIASTVVGDTGIFDVVITDTTGSTTSSGATLTVSPAPVAPGITTPPQSQTVVAGGPVTFTVLASGTSPLIYQWRKNASNLAGRTSNSLTIPAVILGDAGAYDVVVTNSVGSATSASATLTVNPAPVSPTIATPPQSQTVVVGSQVNFSVAVTGTAPFTYQWRKSSENLAGQTGNTLTIPSADLDDAGPYDVVVTNAAGSATSAAAILTVNPAAVGPNITTQPQSQTVVAGSTVSFSVVGTGSAPLNYQWRKNGSNIPGAVFSSHSFTPTFADNGAQMSVVLSNSVGSVTSAPATLTVNLKPLDLDTDGVTNVLDLAQFFKLYAPGIPVSNSPADLNGDGFVDDADLALLLAGI